MSPALGTAAAPTLAAVAVTPMVTIWPKFKDTSLRYAMKKHATASYKAVPSMLIVAPRGSVKSGS